MLKTMHSLNNQVRGLNYNNYLREIQEVNRQKEKLKIEMSARERHRLIMKIRTQHSVISALEKQMQKPKLIC